MSELPDLFETTTVQLQDLVPYEYNPRKMTDKQRSDLQKSLEKFGIVDLISINKDGTVIGGHQRLRLMLDMGMPGDSQVEVRRSKKQLSDHDYKELNVRMNLNLGDFDWDILNEKFNSDDLISWGMESFLFGDKDIDLGDDFDEEGEGDDVPVQGHTRRKNNKSDMVVIDFMLTPEEKKIAISVINDIIASVANVSTHSEAFLYLINGQKK